MKILTWFQLFMKGCGMDKIDRQNGWGLVCDVCSFRANGLVAWGPGHSLFFLSLIIWLKNWSNALFSRKYFLPFIWRILGDIGIEFSGKEVILSWLGNVALSKQMVFAVYSNRKWGVFLQSSPNRRSSLIQHVYSIFQINTQGNDIKRLICIYLTTMF